MFTTLALLVSLNSSEPEIPDGATPKPEALCIVKLPRGYRAPRAGEYGQIEIDNFPNAGDISRGPCFIVPKMPPPPALKKGTAT
jgi:hypothetical protein